MTRKRFVVTVCALAMAGASTITCAAANAEGFNQLAGTNRYETSVAISRHAYPSSAENVYLARGDVLADALSAGSRRAARLFWSIPTATTMLPHSM